MRGRVRLLVCTDSAHVRGLLRELLVGHAHIELVGEAADGAEGVRLAGEVAPDVVLMDVAMPMVGGIEATRQLAVSAPAVRVVAFTDSDAPETIGAMFDAGAVDYVVKGAPIWELERAILSARGSLLRLASILGRTAGSASVAELTVRELHGLVGAATVALYLSDPEKGLVCTATAGSHDQDDRELLSELAGQSFRQLVPVVLQPGAKKRPGGSLAVPLVSDGEPLGVIVLARTVGAVRKPDRAYASEAAALAAVALRNERRMALSFLEARRDPLTGLPNRRAFEEQLSRKLEGAESGELPVGLALLDLDGLKQINDEHGHPTGDAVLRDVARVLQRSLRLEEEAFRIGGDEFAVIVAGGAEAARTLAERIRRELASQQRGGPLPTLSAGTAETLTGERDELMRNADAALYTAKQQGRNRVCTHAARAHAASAADVVGADASDRLRVLLVDDDPRLRLLVRTTLESADTEIAEAGDAAQAEQLFREQTPDVIILDIGLPDVDGLSFCRALRSRPDTGKIGIVILSGAGPEYAAAAHEAGADTFLRKPFSPLELLAAVEAAAGRTPTSVGSRSRSADEQLLLYADDMRKLLNLERRQRELLQETYRETVAALVAALDAKDTTTSTHSQRVQRYALELARVVDPRLLENPSAENGFLLHDIGKISIPDRILKKPGKLSPVERRVIETHPVVGAQMLAGVPLLQGVGVEIVRHHHERWDGSGYPDGRAGTEIPLAARIFAVADALDAITSHRPYRAPQSWTTASREIRRHRGRQFDPTVVTALAEAEPQLLRIHATRPRAAGAKLHSTSRLEPSP